MGNYYLSPQGMLKGFRLQGRASSLAALNSLLNTRSCKAFFLLKYFCGFQLSSLNGRI